MASEKDEDVLVLARSMNRFACDLYGRLRTTDGNLFVSPLSISTCLAMAYGGSAGTTRDQMRAALHFDLPKEQLHAAFGSFGKLLTGKDTKQPYDLSVANALWVQRDRTLRKTFVDLIEGPYGGGLHEADFVAARTAAAREINRWVKAHTGGKISRAVKPDTFNKQTRMALVNAIYFKGQWISRFSKDRTKDMAFTLLSPGGGATVTVPMMRQTQQFSYMDNDDLQLLSLPYRGDDVAMLVLLPKSDGSGKHTAAQLERVEKLLTAENLATWIDRMFACNVTVTLPRFTMTREVSLAPVLDSLGMTDAFAPGSADFSGVDGTRELFIQSVEHVAYVDVDEEGTTAAAATTTTFGCSASPPVETFAADHPFVFLIWHLPTRSILFMGRVMNPLAPGHDM
ncbi:MAG: serpin family protein [Anaerolineaceae bacterium]|nr:serpin family protein [Anaerolineaceae bacterium]